MIFKKKFNIVIKYFYIDKKILFFDNSKEKYVTEINRRISRTLSFQRQFQNSSKLSKRPRFDLIKGAFSAVTLQVAASNYPLQLFANDIFAIF